jgi:hypothetical protein
MTNRDQSRPVSEPVLSELLEALGECADDLEAFVEDRYSNGYKEYPAGARRYERDMGPVHRARAAIAKANSQ